MSPLSEALEKPPVGTLLLQHYSIQQGVAIVTASVSIANSLPALTM